MTGIGWWVRRQQFDHHAPDAALDAIDAAVRRIEQAVSAEHRELPALCEPASGRRRSSCSPRNAGTHSTSSATTTAG
ncbi:hypothetical protein ACFVYA_30055 [Amycolatopsis sp. NPDC058278]|uniref:hypothetical protein n=1 Tax=Amycolatopsis sp. NPDC058278 TaxID=3346417 RepID=UPI0036D917AF